MFAIMYHSSLASQRTIYGPAGPDDVGSGPSGYPAVPLLGWQTESLLGSRPAGLRETNRNLTVLDSDYTVDQSLRADSDY
jgi:hypothetical protein